MPKLVIFRGDAVENEVRLAGSTVRIGRHNRNDIVLDDSLNGVSRFHAEIRAEGGAYIIVDLNSRNGVWINGRRIKEKAALALGVPVTVGAFELALEDDASTGEFDEPLVNQHTVVTAPAGDPRGGPSGSGTRSRSMRSPVAATRRQMLLWAGGAVTLLVVCAVTFAVVRYKTRPAPIVARVEPPPVLQQDPPPPPPPAEDPNKKAIELHLADARTQMAAGDFTAALNDHLRPVLELDPENVEALALKQQADQAIAAAAAQVTAQAQKAPRAVAKPETPTEPETPGIPRRSNELYTEYLGRARRIQVAYDEGKASLEKQEYAAAIAHFRVVERDQPRYQNVVALVADAISRQQKAFDEAMNGGQANEQAGKLKDARQWYQRALEIDAGSTSARERNASLLNRMNTEATKLFDKATLALKLQDREGAIRQLQQILDLMLPGDEIREKATKQLEVLKR